MTTQPDMLAVEDRHLDAVLDLNNRYATELSWLERDRLAELVAASFHCRVIGPSSSITSASSGVEAFLMSFDERADYDSPNFQWFRERYPRFVYVDRVVVDPAARGRGHARRLYAELFDLSRDNGHEVVTAEVNADPPNPASDAFHAAMGFAPIGEAAIDGGAKVVRYYLRSL